MWSLLFENFSKRGIRLTEAELEIVQSVFKHKSYRKYQYLLQQGDVCKYEIFVVKGMLRTYLVDDKGQEHVIKFSPEDWWAGDLSSFFTEHGSSYNIDCMEDTEVLVVTKPDLESLFNQVPQMNKYFRILYQNSVVSYNKRIAASLCNTALERYQDFIKKYPQIEQRVPNHQIASFLGITPQSLSRLRKQAVKS